MTEVSALVQDGSATGQIPLTILDDSLPEVDEKFTVALLRVVVDDPVAMTVDAPRLGELTNTTVIIATNDNANGAFRIYSTSLSADAVRRRVTYQEMDKLAVDLIVERQGTI
jgi:hypothetical protein